MRRRRSGIVSMGVGIAVLLLAAVSLGHGGDEEEAVALDKVPQPILESVSARFPGAAVREAAKETEQGKLVYEISIRDKGQDVDVTLAPDGRILVIEKEIVARDLPAAVTKALEDRYPAATFRIVEEILEVGQDRELLAYYEVLLGTGSQKAVEVQVTAEGKIVHEEKKSSAAHDAEEE